MSERLSHPVNKWQNEKSYSELVFLKHYRPGKGSPAMGGHHLLFSQVEELNSIIKELTADSTQSREAPLKTQVSEFEVRVFISKSDSLRSSFQERPGLCS